MNAATTGPGTVEVRPADRRFRTRLDWLDSRHSFSFGPHRDPNNVGHGLLIVSNDDVVAPGGGFGTHSHRDMEIVTWVLEGRLEHRDSEGNLGELYPGLVQRMSAGSGIRHSEMNASSDEPVHFVQMWVPPSEVGIEPGYEQSDVNDDLAQGGLIAVASGRPEHTGGPGITIRQPAAAMYVGRPEVGRSIELPIAPFVHLYIARGAVELRGHSLAAGDAVRLTDAGPVELRATESSEIIVWATDEDAFDSD